MLAKPVLPKKKPPLQTEQQAIASPSTLTPKAPPSPPKTVPPPTPPAATQVGVPPPPQPPTGPSPVAPVVPPPPPPAAVQAGIDANLTKPPTAAQEKPSAPAPTKPPEFNDIASQLLMQQLQAALGGADTTEEEALIRQQMEDAIGAQLVDQRASMGRAGFGGGTLAALEGDIQREARQQGLQDILGLRRSESQRAIENAMGAIGTDIDLRKQAEDEFFTEQYLNALQSALGMDQTSMDDTDLGANFANAAVGEGSPLAGVVDAVRGKQKQTETATVGANVVDAPPEGFDFYQTLSNGDTLYRNDATGEVVRVKKAG